MNTAIAEAIRKHLPDARVEVDVEGNGARITVISPTFEGLSRVKRQQAVYAGVAPFISDGTLHAVSIRALTPEEA